MAEITDREIARNGNTVYYAKQNINPAWEGSGGHSLNNGAYYGVAVSTKILGSPNGDQSQIYKYSYDVYSVNTDTGSSRQIFDDVANYIVMGAPLLIMELQHGLLLTGFFQKYRMVFIPKI